MNRKTFAFLAIFIFSFSGCTSLSSKKLATSSYSPQGLTYRLPVKQFSVKANFQITGCQAHGNDAALEATVNATLSESLVGGEAYTIDYEKLNTWTKITNTEFQLSEAGLLTGVNASITDQSGVVLSNTASAIASVARGTVLPSIKLEPLPEAIQLNNFLNSTDISEGKKLNLDAIKNNTKTYNILRDYEGSTINKGLQNKLLMIKKESLNLCAPVTDSLSEKDKLEKSLKNENELDKKRVSEQKKISDSEIQIKAINDLVDIYSKLGNDKEKNDLMNRVKLQQKIKEDAEAMLKALGDSKASEISKKISDIKDKLSISVSHDFFPDLSSAPCEAPSFDKNNSVITNQKKMCDVPITNTDLKNLLGDKADVSKIHLPIVSFIISALHASAGDEGKTPNKESLGIAYRIPVASIAKLVYRIKNADGTLNKAPTLILEEATQVPQFGPIGSINLENRAFDDNLIELAFNPNTGSPSKLTFRAKSKAEAASSGAHDAAETYLQLQKDKQADRVAAFNAQIDANKALIDQATAKANLEKTQSDVALSKVQSDAAAAKALSDLQQSKVDAQIQLLRDQQRLDAVRTGTATKDEVELEALNTQEQLLEQRLKILKLQQEIADQKTKSASSTSP